MLTAQRHTVINQTVISDYRRFADHDTHAMVDNNTAANGGPGVNLNAGKKTAPGGDDSGQQLYPRPPQPMSHPMPQQSVDAGGGEKHVHAISSRRVTLEGRSEVFADFGPRSHGV
jgi:hypothetical protein